jgi:tetratricopeptide (TPR) repeat protein
MNQRAIKKAPSDIGSPKTAPSGGGSVRAALERGDYEEAASEFLALPTEPARGVLSPAEAVSLAGRLRENRQPKAALTLLQRVIRGAPRASGVAEAYALAGSIVLEDRRDPTAAYQYLVAALKAGPKPDTDAEVRRNLAAIEAQQRMHVGRLRGRRR